MSDTPLLSLWIHGQPPRKSNSRQIVDGVNGPMSIKSDAALQWFADAMKQVTGDKRLRLGSLERPLAITCWVYYKTRRPDLSIELVKDMLQECGVIRDDRYIYEEHSYKRFSRDEPGVRIEIRRCETC